MVGVWVRFLQFYFFISLLVLVLIEKIHIALNTTFDHISKHLIWKIMYSNTVLYLIYQRTTRNICTQTTVAYTEAKPMILVSVAGWSILIMDDFLPLDEAFYLNEWNASPW